MHRSKRSLKIAPPDVLGAAEALMARGCAVLPLPYGKKDGAGKNWPNRRIHPAEVAQYFCPGKNNVGVLLGAASGGLIDVDLDSPDAVELAQLILPRTDCVFGHDSKPSSHWVYRCAPLPGYKKFEDLAKQPIVEVRGNGRYTVFPGSMHPSGEVIRPEPGANGDPTAVDPSALWRAVTELATACLLRGAWPRESGCRQDLAMAIDGGLARLSWTKERIARFLRAVTDRIDEEDRTAVAGLSILKLEDGEPITGWPTVAELLGERGEGLVRRVRRWLEAPPSLEAVEGSTQRRRNPETQDTQRSSREGAAGETSPPSHNLTEPSPRMIRLKEDNTNGCPPTLPLDEHFAAAIEWTHWDLRNPSPNRNGRDWWWPLLRHCRFHPELMSMTAEQGLAALEKILRHWPTPDQSDPWRHHVGSYDDDEESVREALAMSWGLCKSPPWTDLPRHALNLAIERPFALPPEHRTGSDRYGKFLSMCWHMARLRGDEPFFLSVSKVMEVFGMKNRGQAHKMFLAAQGQGYLICVSKAQGREKAAEYRFQVTGMQPNG
jgi:hypothetical protein